MRGQRSRFRTDMRRQREGEIVSRERRNHRCGPGSRRPRATRREPRAFTLWLARTLARARGSRMREQQHLDFLLPAPPCLRVRAGGQLRAQALALRDGERPRRHGRNVRGAHEPRVGLGRDEPKTVAVEVRVQGRDQRISIRSMVKSRIAAPTCASSRPATSVTGSARKPIRISGIDAERRKPDGGERPIASAARFHSARRAPRRARPRRASARQRPRGAARNPGCAASPDLRRA